MFIIDLKPTRFLFRSFPIMTDKLSWNIIGNLDEIQPLKYTENSFKTEQVLFILRIPTKNFASRERICHFLTVHAEEKIRQTYPYRRFEIIFLTCILIFFFLCNLNTIQTIRLCFQTNQCQHVELFLVKKNWQLYK